jgi:hypothetical protein
MGTAVVLGMLMAGQSPAPLQPPDPPVPPVSVERIHEGLQRPALTIPPLEVLPVFRGSVEVELVLDTPLQAMRRELAEDSGYSGRRGIDVLGAVMGIVKGIKAARRTRAEAEIRQEVQAELNAFCAEHDCSVLESGPPPIEGIIIPRKRAIE